MTVFAHWLEVKTNGGLLRGCGLTVPELLRQKRVPRLPWLLLLSLFSTYEGWGVVTCILRPGRKTKTWEQARRKPHTLVSGQAGIHSPSPGSPHLPP